MNIFLGLFALFMSSVSVAERIYINSWAIIFNEAPQNIERIVKKHGFHNLGKIFEDGNYYYVTQKRVAKQSLQAHRLYNLRLKMDPKVFWFAQQFSTIRKRRHPPSRLNDPLFKEQWFLSDAFGQNVLAAWALGYTGKGVVVSILDDGIEKGHPDLKDNYDPQASYDMNDNDIDPEPRYTKTGENSHGTRCAGEVAAVANNRVCGVGVAYQSKIGGIRMLDGHVTDLVEAKSLNWNQQYIDIYTASWGPQDNGKIVDGPNTLALEAFIKGISNGRRGLGSIYIWASGNGGTSSDNCNLDGYVNSIYTLSVSSATERGTVPFYSEPCSAILTSTYSGGSLHQRKIVTTDLGHTCTSDHTGTSASAPLASGIIALALEANPTLTWRDVQHITVRASRPADLRADDWQTNGVGRSVSHYYGYGLLDALRLVDLARKWKAVRPQRQCHRDVIAKPHELRGSLVLQWNESACLGTQHWIRSLEHIRARLTLTFTRRGDLSIVLISPMGTHSTLVTVRPFDASPMGYSDWAFMSTHCWDEEPRGIWTLQIENKGNLSNRGILSNLRLELYGTDEHMTGRRMERTVVQQCAVWDANGDCRECNNPLYKFESICLLSCPPHYYEWGNNDTHSLRRCLPCHQTCQTCYGEWETNCLDCPPFSTLDPGLGTCSAPVYPWDHRSMNESEIVLIILLACPLVILCLLLVTSWVVNRALASQIDAGEQVSSNRCTGETREVEMVILNRAAQNELESG